MRKILTIIGLLLLFCLPNAEAQTVVFDTINDGITADTIVSTAKVPKHKREHSAKTATIMSACLPGLGQIYNGKWWKVPIVYAGLGGLGYLSFSNHYEYKSYLMAYEFKTGDLPEGTVMTEYATQLAERYQESQLQSYKESYRRNFELYTIITVVWYGVQIVDACVDGHLYTYDISDDLSFHIDPCFQFNDPYGNTMPPLSQVGLSFNLNF